MYNEAEREATSRKWAYAINTQRTMTSQVKAYVRFCVAFGHNPAPRKGISEKQLIHYVM